MQCWREPMGVRDYPHAQRCLGFMGRPASIRAPPSVRWSATAIFPSFLAPSLGASMFAKLITPDAPSGFLLFRLFSQPAPFVSEWLNSRQHDLPRDREQLIMAIYKLTPLDPTDSIWRQFPFVEAVWTNARDEHDARARVSKIAHEMNPDLVGPMNCWPWIYFARCAPDKRQFAIARDEVVNTLGHSVANPLPQYGLQSCLAAE
jgi:hypothetical protein